MKYVKHAEHIQTMENHRITNGLPHLRMTGNCYQNSKQIIRSLNKNTCTAVRFCNYRNVRATHLKKELQGQKWNYVVDYCEFFTE
jgi:hypothetical protein